MWSFVFKRLSLFGQHHQIVIVCECIVLTAFKRKQSKVGKTSLEGSSSHLSSAISNRNITFSQQRKTQTRTLSRVMILRQTSQYIQEPRSNFEIRGRGVGVICDSILGGGTEDTFLSNSLILKIFGGGGMSSPLPSLLRGTCKNLVGNQMDHVNFRETFPTVWDNLLSMSGSRK